MVDPTPLLLGCDAPAVRALAEVLGADLELLAPGSSDAECEAWRARIAGGEPRAHVVVAMWCAEPAAGELVALERSGWDARAEEPLLSWNLALGAAAERCADGGALVAVAESPAAIDAAGFVPEVGIAEAVVALVRSLAQSEGPRGVRANTVTTPARLGGPQVALPVPPLASFPGSLERETAGCVRLLLSEDAVGLTGRVLAADCGRSA